MEFESLKKFAFTLLGSVLLLILKNIGSQLKQVFIKRKNNKDLATYVRQEILDNYLRIEDFSKLITKYAKENHPGFILNLPPEYTCLSNFAMETLKLITQAGGTPDKYTLFLRRAKTFERLFIEYNRRNVPAVNWRINPNVEFKELFDNSDTFGKLLEVSKEILSIMEKVIKGNRLWQILESKRVKKVAFLLVLLLTFTFLPSDAE